MVGGVGDGGGVGGELTQTSTFTKPCILMMFKFIERKSHCMIGQCLSPVCSVMYNLAYPILNVCTEDLWFNVCNLVSYFSVNF